MLGYFDYYLDRMTMYRLVLYSLMGLIFIATIFGVLGLLPIDPVSLVFSTLFLISICFITNKIFSYAFDAPTNVESACITALVLALIISPLQRTGDVMFLFWAGILSMASKYILALGKKHLFNPAAIAVVLTAVFLGESASWWVGTSLMMPFVAFSGFLIIRKLRFEDLAWSFFMTVFVVSCAIALMKGSSMITTLTQLLFHSSVVYLGSIMLTEPLTLPPTKQLQAVYGALVGFLTVPQIHFGSIFFSPELALCIGNIFAYIVSPKGKLVLFLQEKMLISKDVIDFIFKPSQKLAYLPGQYMEWTLPHKNSDSRGNRRYFTLASSPTEKTIRLGVKFYENGSSYKRIMQQLDTATPLVGAQLAGNFTLPKDKNKKIVFIAGGIGITPFRSMIKYLVDMNERRDIILFYTNRTADEIIYRDVFTLANQQLNIRTIYTLTNVGAIPPYWIGRVGRIDAAMLSQEVPDFAERLFYLSGPYTMINAFEKTLKEMGVKKEQIKKDFFPGLV